ncbi:MAG: ABC transporter, permease protein (cluster 2, ribose/xylose/arabinose/galactose) [Firmicutes bacterium]|nr:ABC transporter, permease protein (cluster 2, ribose/xylose/arabinose/galactose) [Bacillota bacterium]MDI6706765.1 ABC transporter permease [Bacillota bacterium]
MAEVSKVVVNKTDKSDSKNAIKRFLVDSSVPVLFVIVCLLGVYFSKLPMLYIVNELMTRITRNAFLVLALIIPVIAGLGLNFGIVIGAMAGQFAIIAVKHWHIGGFAGFMACIALSTPMAILFGILTAKLLNRTKGQEMISSMIAGFFATGIYQFILLFLVGTLIPMKDEVLVLTRGIGITNTIDLSKGGNLTYSLDNLLKLPLFEVLAAASVAALIIILINFYMQRKNGREYSHFKLAWRILLCIGIFATSFYIISAKSPLRTVKLPIATTVAILALCLFNSLILKTKLGQDFRTIGQDLHIAKISGIDVDRTRQIAVVISTILAAWGQIIFLQNIGTLSTYGSHVQVATFAIAAILLGGASVTKATNGQAILGVILFHTLFIVSPKAGNNLFGEAQIGEFFRAFVAYGVIGVALGLHAWKKTVVIRKK